MAEQDQKETAKTQCVTTQLRVGYFVTINKHPHYGSFMVSDIDADLGVRLKGLLRRYDISELTVVEIARDNG